MTHKELMAELLKLKTSGVPTEGEAEPVDAEVSDSVAESSAAEAVYPVTFESPHDFVRSFERDIRFGGLFLPADEPADQDETVTLEFRFGWESELVVRVEALVVKRFMSAEGSTSGESVSGMGVAFVDPAEVISRFEQVRERLAQADADP